MNKIIQKALTKINDQSPLKSFKQVYGGSINESFYIETANNKYFLKFHRNAPYHFFELEKLGLELIKETYTISVPTVLAHSDELGKSFLLMEWIDGKRNSHTEKQLGTEIAKMHHHFGEYHGFHKNTYIGLLHQPNGLFNSWLEYYRNKRLKSQLKEGIKRNKISGKRRDQLEKLLDRLDQWIPKQVKPSYLHGDLWGGNWLIGSNGRPFVIDPSFVYGDRHFELAFTELFGGFSEEFYIAYQNTFPIDSYYQEVKPLYQLYYLLVHLNIFGESYGSRVDEILNKYVGY